MEYSLRVSAIALAASLGLLACGGPKGPEGGTGDEQVFSGSIESPWHGLKAEAAVERFLELSIPYELSNAYLVDSLSSAYDTSLAPALARALDAIEGESDEADLERLLLFRVGCRWALQRGAAAPADGANELREERRRTLLRHMSAAVDAMRSSSYRAWLANSQTDLECLDKIAALRAKDTAASRPAKP